jgi:hypothetical protein
MGNIFEDITKDIEIKPAKSKMVLTWVVRIALALITASFAYGQYKVLRADKMKEFEKTLIENTNALKDLKSEMNLGFDKQNGRIDKIYDDGIKEFNSFQEYNKKQLILIIDYGQTNKSLLKQMLEVNSMEKSKAVEMQLGHEKTIMPPLRNDSMSIIVQPVKPKK